MTIRQASGQSVAELCAETGVSKASFFAWRKRLRPARRKRGAAGPLQENAPPLRADATPATSPLVPVRIVDDRTAAIVVSVLRSQPGETRSTWPLSNVTSTAGTADVFRVADESTCTRTNAGDRRDLDAKAGQLLTLAV